MKHFIGIDPGLTGALAHMDGFGGLTGVEDLPVIRDGSTAWIDGQMLFMRLMHYCAAKEPNEVWIERVHAMPKQGVSSSFTFGVTFGSILGTLRAAACSIHFVSPQKWKKDLGLGSEKSAALDKARILYPTADLELAKHHGRAEAILIAHWARTCSWKKP